MTNKRNRLENHSPLEQLLATLLASFLVAGMPTTVLADNVLGNEGNINGGAGTINAAESNGAGMTQVINQNTSQMLIDYNNNFNIQGNDILVFEQPDAAASVVNRVIDFEGGGINPSQLLGQIQANGQVFVINPSGIFVGSGAVIDAAGFFAIGAALGDHTQPGDQTLLNNFNSALIGDGFTFSQLTGDVDVAALGSIRADLVALAGNHVTNAGNIEAINGAGMIAMVAGDSVVLKTSGSVGVRFDNVGSNNTDAPAGTGILNTGSLNASNDVSLLAAGDMYAVAIHQSNPVVPQLSATYPNDPAPDAPGNLPGGYQRAPGVDAPAACEGGACAMAANVSMDGRKVGTGTGTGLVQVAGKVSGSNVAITGNDLDVDLDDITIIDPEGPANGKLTLGTTNFTIADTGDVANLVVSGTDITLDADDVVAALDGADLDLVAVEDVTVNEVVNSTLNDGRGDLGLIAGKDLNINENVSVKGAFTGRANENDTDGTAGAVTFGSGGIFPLALRTEGDLTLEVADGDAPGNITLPGTLQASLGSVRVSGDAVLQQDTRVTANGNVTFEKTINSDGDGAFGLNVDSTLGDNRFEGQVGTGSDGRLAYFETDTTGTPNVGSTFLSAVSFGTTVATTGDQVYGDAVVLETDQSLLSVVGDITFERTIDAADNGSDVIPAPELTVNTLIGDNTFEGRIGSGQGGTDPQGLGAFNTDDNVGTAGQTGRTFLDMPSLPGDPGIRSGNVRFGDDVVIGQDTVIDGTGTAGGSLGPVVNFLGAVDAANDGEDGTAHDLTVNAAVAFFNGDVGQGNNPEGSAPEIDPDGIGTLDNGSGLTLLGYISRPESITIRTAEGQTHGGDLLLATNTTLLSTAGDITVDGAIDAADTGDSEVFGLDVTTTAGNNVFLGAIGDGQVRSLVFGQNPDGLAYFRTDDVGIGNEGITRLAGTPGDTGLTVKTTGEQVYADDVVIGNVDENDAVTGAQQNLLSSTGDITFEKTLNGVQDVDGNAASHLAVTTTTGDNVFQGQIGTGTDGRLASFATDTLDSNGTDDGTGNAGTTFLAAQSSSPTIETTGDQTYGDDVVLQNNQELVAYDSDTAAGNITFEKTINSDGDGTFGLKVTTTNGDNRFEGQIGTAKDGTTPTGRLAYLETDTVDTNGTDEGTGNAGTTFLAAQESSPTIETTGDQTYADDVVLEQDQELISASGNITFEKTINSDGNGAHGLAVTTTTGDNNFQGQIGTAEDGTTPTGQLAYFETDTVDSNGETAGTGNTGRTRLAAQSSSPTVSTTGNQQYADDVELDANQELLSSTGDITFERHVFSDVDGNTPYGLTVNTPEGDNFFRGGVGTDVALAYFETDDVPSAGDTGTTWLGGLDPSMLVDTEGRQTYNDDVVLVTNTLMESAEGDITFEGTVDSDGDGAAGLEVNTETGDNIFRGWVGTEGGVGGDPQGRLAYLRTDVPNAQVDNEQKTVLGDANGAPAIFVLTSGEQRYGDEVSLESGAVLIAGDISPVLNGSDVPFGSDIVFHDDVDSETADAFGLEVISTNGNNVFHGNVGSAGRLLYLATDGSIDPTASEEGAPPFGYTIFAAREEAPNGTAFLDGNGEERETKTVDTLNDQRYRDEVLLEVDTILTSGEGDIEFQQDVNGLPTEIPPIGEAQLAATNVNGTSSEPALTVSAGRDVIVGGNIGVRSGSPGATLREVNLESNVNPGEEEGEGDIKFTGIGSQSVEATEKIALNTNRGAPPQTATIYKTLKPEPDDEAVPGDLSDALGAQGPIGGPQNLLFITETGTFSMEQNDKISVPEGGLGILAGGGARIGDLNALNVVVINQPGREAPVTAIARSFGPVQLSDGTTVNDVGLEIISNQVMIYATTLTTEGGGILYVATPDGASAIGVTGGQAVQRAFRNDFRQLTTADFTLTSESGLAPESRTVLDQVALGPGNLPTNVIPYIPSEEEKNPSGTANRNAVAQRPLRPDELLSFFDCMEKTEDVRFECEEEYVGTERATSPEAEKLRALANDLFVDSSAGESPEARDKRILGDAVASYKSRTGAGRVEGAAFRRFVETSPQQADALEILDKYGALFQGVREFGATDEAYDALKSTKLQRIAPAGLSTEELGNAVEAGMTARPVESGVRVASSDRFYLFQGLESQRLYLMEKPQAEVE